MFSGAHQRFGCPSRRSQHWGAVGTPGSVRDYRQWRGGRDPSRPAIRRLGGLAGGGVVLRLLSDCRDPVADAGDAGPKNLFLWPGTVEFHKALNILYQIFWAGADGGRDFQTFLSCLFRFFPAWGSKSVVPRVSVRSRCVFVLRHDSLTHSVSIFSWFLGLFFQEKITSSSRSALGIILT